MRLGDGHEGIVPILDTMPKGFEEVAVVSVQADSLATPERLARHLQRRASLLGCDGVMGLMVSGDNGRAVCVRRREPVPVAVPVVVTVRDPSAELIKRAARAGADGRAVLQVLAQVEQRPAGERAWPLRWFLENYPSSPFRDDLASLIVETPLSPSRGRSATVRTAPTLP